MIGPGEFLQGGPQRLNIAGKFFQVDRKKVIADSSVKTFGIVPIDAIRLKSTLLEQGAMNVFGLLDRKSRDEHCQKPIGLLWYESAKSGRDILFVKIPILLDGSGKTSEVVTMMDMQSGSGRAFAEALQNPSITRPAMAEILAPIMQSTNRPINYRQIWVDHLAIYPESAVAVADQTLKKEANMEELYRQYQAKMRIVDVKFQSEQEYEMLKTGGEDIDLSEFVQQSVFFRDPQKAEKK